MENKKAFSDIFALIVEGNFHEKTDLKNFTPKYGNYMSGNVKQSLI